MISEPDLAAAMATAYRHCKPDGVALLVLYKLKESFSPDTDCGGHDGPSGEGIRFLAWSYHRLVLRDPRALDETEVTLRASARHFQTDARRVATSA